MKAQKTGYYKFFSGNVCISAVFLLGTGVAFPVDIMECEEDFRAELIGLVR